MDAAVPAILRISNQRLVLAPIQRLHCISAACRPTGPGTDLHPLNTIVCLEAATPLCSGVRTALEGASSKNPVRCIQSNFSGTRFLARGFHLNPQHASTLSCGVRTALLDDPLPLFPTFIDDQHGDAALAVRAVICQCRHRLDCFHLDAGISSYVSCLRRRCGSCNARGDRCRRAASSLLPGCSEHEAQGTVTVARCRSPLISLSSA